MTIQQRQNRVTFAGNHNPSSKWTAEDHLARACQLLDAIDGQDGRDRVYTIQSACHKIQAHLAIAKYKEELA